MPGTVPTILHIWIHLILITTLQGRDDYYHCFIIRKSRVRGEIQIRIIWSFAPWEFPGCSGEINTNAIQCGKYYSDKILDTPWDKGMQGQVCLDEVTKERLHRGGEWNEALKEESEFSSRQRRDEGRYFNQRPHCAEPQFNVGASC